MKKPHVININSGDSYDVYIGRAGKGKDGYFGNPITEGTRTEKLEGYNEYIRNRIQTDEEFREKVKALDGKTLGCFCKPKRCHGDILAEMCVKLNIEDDVFS